MSEDIEAYLDQLQADYEEAKSDDFHIDAPDGEYIWDIVGAEVNVSKGGRLQAFFKLTIAGGDHKGTKAAKFDGLDNVKNIGYFKKGLKALGVELPKQFKDIAKTVAAMQGMKVKALLRSKAAKDDPNKIFQNIFFQRRVAATL